MSAPEWIKWHGGECPVDGNQRVWVQLGNGAVLPNVRARALRWQHHFRNINITAYRLSEQAA